MLCTPPNSQSTPKVRGPKMDLITELKRKQQKEPLIYESDRDGAIEDIITGEACPATELCPSCLFPSTPPTWALSGCLIASCFFFSCPFLFFPFSSFPRLPPQCSRQCPSLPVPANGHPGSSVRPAWERTSHSSAQVPAWPGLRSQQQPVLWAGPWGGGRS